MSVTKDMLYTKSSLASLLPYGDRGHKRFTDNIALLYFTTNLSALLVLVAATGVVEQTF